MGREHLVCLVIDLRVRVRRGRRREGVSMGFGRRRDGRGTGRRREGAREGEGARHRGTRKEEGGGVGHEGRKGGREEGNGETARGGGGDGDGDEGGEPGKLKIVRTSRSSSWSANGESGGTLGAVLKW